MNFSKIFKELNKHGVEYIIIGGVAAIGHGMTYITTDVDICYKRSKANIESIVKALKPSNPKLRIPGGNLPFHFDEKTLQNGINFTLDTDWGLLDLLGEVPGLGRYEDLLKNSVKIEFYGAMIDTLSLDDLIRAKKIAGRNKDKLHLLELEALKDILRK